MPLQEGDTWLAKTRYTLGVRTSDLKGADFDGRAFITLSGYWGTTKVRGWQEGQPVVLPGARSRELARNWDLGARKWDPGARDWERGAKTWDP